MAKFNFCFIQAKFLCLSHAKKSFRISLISQSWRVTKVLSVKNNQREFSESILIRIYDIPLESGYLTQVRITQEIVATL